MMERLEVNYSTKNIPIPSKNEYRTQLMAKVEHVTKRMRWKALEFLGRLHGTQKVTYGFRSRKCPQTVPELAEFESDLMKMVKNVKFKSIRNDFQNRLRRDIQTIKETNSILVAADKSRNIYKMSKDDYNKNLVENITKTYKKSNEKKVKNINQETQKIVKDLGVDDRVEIMQTGEVYITVKDHKDDFPNKLTFRLINPSKSDIGKISKKIVEKVNSNLRDICEINQWKNTTSVLEWFKNINHKKECKFVNLDIENFYPSISEDLLNKSIQYAQTHINISASDLEIIMQSRKTLLFHNNQPWVKKNGNEDFDVPMGCNDGAEICELVGIFVLNKLSEIVDKNDFGLYRDDGLGILRKQSGPNTDRLRKKIIKVFNDLGLSITIQTNLRVVNFLDVTLNLSTNTFMPYRKPNDLPVYINKSSNHPPPIKKQIVKSISTRLSNISSNETVFKKSLTQYENAIKESGFNEKLSYCQVNGPNTEARKKRRRNIIWFNPPYSENVTSNIGRTFLNLVSRHFPKGNPLNKIFNKNSVKVSYSCTRNVNSIISSHNQKILNPSKTEFGCNCRNKSSCPLDGKCLTPNTVYQAKITNDVDNETKYYIGMSEPPFKARYNNHNRDFNNERYRFYTELSKYVWMLKDSGKNPKVEYKCLKKVFGRARLNFCTLCLTEKLFIMDFEPDELLVNKREELISKCRHQNKFLLSNFGRKDSND